MKKKLKKYVRRDLDKLILNQPTSNWFLITNTNVFLFANVPQGVRPHFWNYYSTFNRLVYLPNTL